LRGLGSSFAGDQNKIRAALKCNLVLMKKKNGTKPLVLHFTPQSKDSRPIGHAPVSLGQGASPRLYNSITYIATINTDLTSRQNGASPRQAPGASPTTGTEAASKGQETGDTDTFNDNLEVFSALRVHSNDVVIEKLQNREHETLL
jgi:hypothetical protein